MKNPIILITAVLLTLSGCRSVNKSLVKTSETEKTKIEAHTVTTNSAGATASTNITRTITEEYADTANVKGAVVTGSVSADALDHGQVVDIVTPTGTTSVQKNLKTGAISHTTTTKDTKVPVVGKKTTTENINSTSSSTSAGVAIQDLKINQEVHKESKNNNVKKSSNMTTWLIIIILAAAGVLLIILWIRRKKKQIAAATKL